MENKDLQARYSALKERLRNLGLERAKLEANIETIEKRQTELEKDIKRIAAVNSVEEAVEKEKSLHEKIDKIIKEAEELLDD